jgi:molybdopterin/thiamine biosynthesis adenylyltransferase
MIRSRDGESGLGHRVPAVAALRNAKVAVIGLGAIGSPIAIELARNGVGKLHVLDHDVV